MINLFRKFLDTRAARLFFVVLIVPFVWWGVAGLTRNSGSDTTVATVGDRHVEAADLQEETRRQLAQIARMGGANVDPTPEMRRAVAAQVLDRQIIQAAIADEVTRLGLVVPDDAVRQSIYDIPAFRGPGGSFDRTTFQARLRQNNLTEGRFIELMRSDLGQRQLMEAVQVGVTAPEVLLKRVFAFQRETRVVDMVELPFAAAPEPSTPTEAELKAAYDDDPQRYAAPAMRRIKAVILSPETAAAGITVPEPDIEAYYEAHKSEFGGPEKRGVQVVTAQDEATAQKLAAAWRAGADWPAMQKDAADAGAAAAVLDDATREDLPGTALATAAFAAPTDVVTGPVPSEFGWQVLRVTHVTPGNEQPLSAVHDQVKARLARERATDQVYSSANKLEDELNAGSDFDHIPADLGAALMGGSIDPKGNTESGDPAPIPGSPALRQAIVTAAFATKKGEPPHLIEGPDQSYFAISVESETPPEVKPFEAVQAQVRQNWEADARRRAQEVVAAKLLTAAKDGSLDDAAVVAGVHAERSPPITRNSPAAGVPNQLIQPVFLLPKDGATMIELPDAFWVVKLAEVTSPDLSSDPVGAAQTRTALAQALAQDAELSFAVALRDRAKPTVNRALLDQVSQ